MEICTLASGSSGNCSLVTEGCTHVLIDAGISLRRVKCALNELGLEPTALSAIFITHAHTDHISALPSITKHLSVPVFASPLTASGLKCMLPGREELILELESGRELSCGELKVRSFITPHDTAESVGYTFSGGGKTFAFVTDTGHITEEILAAVLGADAAVVEANHDLNMLINGPYPQRLKQRILSRRGHLSNDDCGKLSALLWKAGARRIVLAHLSKDNNTPAAALRTVGAALMKAGAVPGRDIELSAAPPSEISGPYII
jgi:phosphoribosyl 1,2-cyclic phosphodiesterase